MRGLAPDPIGTPVPLASTLPGLYRQFDGNVVTFAEALDEVISPVWSALDCYSAYVDPMLAPMDFVEMLAGWVGVVVDRNWREDQVRRLVATAVQLYRWRGTIRGLSDLVEAYTGSPPDIEDSGGVEVSPIPGGAPPGTAVPSVRIRVGLPGGRAEDLARLGRLVAESMPAHIAFTVEVMSTPEGSAEDGG